MLDEHLVCRDGRSEESLLERRGVWRTLAARRNHQTALGTLLQFVKERALILVEDVEVDGALVVCSNDCFCLTASYHRDGSLAVNKLLHVQQTAEESFSCGSVHRHCVGDLHASVRVSEWRALLSFVGLASSFESFDARHGVLVERKCFLPFCATVWCSLI